MVKRRGKERVNGADGISDIEGKVTRVGASERGQRTSFNGAAGTRATHLRRGYVVAGIDGQTARSNRTFGKSEIEGKTAREAASELGKERVSNGPEPMSQLWGNDRVSTLSRFRSDRISAPIGARQPVITA